MPHEPVSVRVLRSIDELAGLRGEWSELVARCPFASPFVECDWLLAWWAHYGSGRDLRVIVAKEGARLVGALPMYVQRQRLWRTVPLIVGQNVGVGGDTSPDYLDAIVDPACTGVVEALAAALRDMNRECDVLRLCDWRPEVASSAQLARTLNGSGRSDAERRIPFAGLPESWDAYLQGVSRDHRYAIRNRRKKVQAAGGRFFTWADAAGLDHAYARLAELNRSRFGEKGEAFGSDAYVRFHHERMRQLFAAGVLRLHCLEIGGELSAMLYCFRHRDTVLYLQAGFDPAHSRLSPGLALFSYAIESAIAEGAREFDMLRGEHSYKSHWATGERSTVTSMWTRASVPGLLFDVHRRKLPALKRRLVGTPKSTVTE
jgi:CelD/BcsL family acetyltransferase involved in cellulose biosynthesis